MEIRKALLSITAIVIVVLFMGMATQPAIATSNQNAMGVSLNKQCTNNKYNANQALNTSNLLSNSFESWYINKDCAHHYQDGYISSFHWNPNISELSNRCHEKPWFICS